MKWIICPDWAFYKQYYLYWQDEVLPKPSTIKLLLSLEKDALFPCNFIQKILTHITLVFQRYNLG